MTARAEIVRYRPEHKRAVAELQRNLWGPDVDQNVHYLEWKYERNPWAGEPRIYLALRDGRVAGMRGFFESRWEAGTAGRVVAVPLADDMAIDADDRNRGVLTQIMQTAVRDLADCGFEYVFSLSAGLITTLGSLAVGWRSAGRYDPIALGGRDVPWRLRLQDRLYRTPLLWRLPAALGGFRAERTPFRRLDAGWPRGGHLELAERPRSQAMARLVSALGHDGRVRHVRSAEYLDWRFANPQCEYRFLYASSGEELDGYLVLRGRPHNVRVCISDLEARSDRLRAELLAASVDHGRFAQLYVWSSTLRPPERAALAERGFAPADPDLTRRGCPCALVRCTRERPPSAWTLESLPLLDPASWDLRMLYSMAG
jgi:GNAT superfamily N-acetyltransferase